MDQIFIQDLSTKCIIGIHKHERKKPRKVLISVSLFTDTKKVGKTDNLENGIDYSKLVNSIREMTSESSCLTIESLAEKIASLCLEHPKALKTIIRVEKPGIIKGVSSIGVQIEREKLN